MSFYRTKMIHLTKLGKIKGVDGWKPTNEDIEQFITNCDLEVGPTFGNKLEDGIVMGIKREVLEPFLAEELVREIRYARKREDSLTYSSMDDVYRYFATTVSIKDSP